MIANPRVEWTEIGWIEVDTAKVGFGDDACRSMLGQPLLDLYLGATSSPSSASSTDGVSSRSRPDTSSAASSSKASSRGSSGPDIPPICPLLPEFANLTRVDLLHSEDRAGNGPAEQDHVICAAGPDSRVIAANSRVEGLPATPILVQGALPSARKGTPGARLAMVDFVSAQRECEAAREAVENATVKDASKRFST
jgi:hypothetical protein